MSVMITGAAGYIGSQIAFTLRDEYPNLPLIGVDNLSKGVACNIPEDMEVRMTDVGSQQSIGNLIRQHNVETIIHCAASVSVPQSVQEPLAFYENNTSKTRTLIETALGAGVRRFIFSSTSAVYGSPEFPRAMKEDDPCRPVSPYGWSKLMAEQIIKDTAAVTNLNFVILRYFNVAGADPLMRTGPADTKSGAVFRQAAMAALGRVPSFTIHGTDYATTDGTAIRDYIHVADLAAVHVQALDWVRTPGRKLTLNVGYGKGSSVMDVVRAMRQTSGRIFPAIHKMRRPGDPDEVIGNVKALHRIGWTHRYANLETIAHHTLNWEQRLDPERY